MKRLKNVDFEMVDSVLNELGLQDLSERVYNNLMTINGRGYRAVEVVAASIVLAAWDEKRPVTVYKIAEKLRVNPAVVLRICRRERPNRIVTDDEIVAMIEEAGSELGIPEEYVEKAKDIVKVVQGKPITRVAAALQLSTPKHLHGIIRNHLGVSRVSVNRAVAKVEEAVNRKMPLPGGKMC